MTDTGAEGVTQWFYHGTKCALEPGQELTAAGAKRADPGYPIHILHVWVTTKPLAAAGHATKHGKKYWNSGHVYQVTPLHPGDVELDPLDNGSRTSWRSPTGFRIVMDLGSPAELWALSPRLAPHAEGLNEATTQKDRWNSLIAETGHAMTWRLDDQGPGHSPAWYGRCGNCDATMSVFPGGTSVGEGIWCARDRPCRGPDTAWQHDMVQELAHDRVTAAVSRFGQTVKDNEDRAWLAEQGLADEPPLTKAGQWSPGAAAPAGELSSDTPYRAALDALDTYAGAAVVNGHAMETLEAQLTVHGFDRDRALMSHIAGLRDAAAAVQEHAQAARTGLIARHGGGDEYHAGGRDAAASAFRAGTGQSAQPSTRTEESTS